MAAIRTFGFALLGMILGVLGGALAGLLGGLAYTSLAGTSSFEGESGFVVAFWILGGIMIGLVVGVVFGVKSAHRAVAPRGP